MLSHFIQYLSEFDGMKQIPGVFFDIAVCFSSVISGMIIGWEREKSGKTAGFRTFIFVSLGSALFTLISKEIGGPEITARIVAQIISGIGFIGAGAVIRDQHRISSGLATAAGIWVCSSVGVIFGLGYLPFGFGITLFVAAVFRAQPRIEQFRYGKCVMKKITIRFKDTGNKNIHRLSAILDRQSPLKYDCLKSSQDIDEKELELHYCSRHFYHHHFLSEVAQFDFVTHISK